ncbi:uncharacterized protein [Aristolochia californica]|uniref:uncharacterized protein n=1 Tax=Aristolochia californica TaxID=171875 RepID=UPI0035D845ED
MQLVDTHAMVSQLANSVQCYKMGLEIQQQELGDTAPRVGETCRDVVVALVPTLQFDEAQNLCQTTLDSHKDHGTPVSLAEAADRRRRCSHKDHGTPVSLAEAADRRRRCMICDTKEDQPSTLAGVAAQMSVPSEHRKVWDSSLSSLKSSKVKGGHHINCKKDLPWNFANESECKYDTNFVQNSLGMVRDTSISNVSPGSPQHITFMVVHGEGNTETSFKVVGNAERSSFDYPVVMLMHIVDDVQHAPLPKIVEDLGGSITSHGSSCTHVITGTVKRTITFCTALCSGAWIVSSDWWKTSFREGRSIGESLFVLQHEDFEPKYKSEVEDAVFRAEASRHALLKGYDVCIDHHVQPPVDTLMASVESASGNVLCGLEDVKEPVWTIFVVCDLLYGFFVAGLNSRMKGPLVAAITVLHVSAIRSASVAPGEMRCCSTNYLRYFSGFKSADYFAYADRANVYWAGYFTSRPAIKGYMRMMCGYYLAASQLEFLKGGDGSGLSGPTTASLTDALALAQHHDGVSGTEK